MHSRICRLTVILGCDSWRNVYICAHIEGELAEHAGCIRQTVIALEQAKYVPSLKLAFKITIAFGVTLEDIFQYEETG